MSEHIPTAEQLAHRVVRGIGEAQKETTYELAKSHEEYAEANLLRLINLLIQQSKEATGDE